MSAERTGPSSKRRQVRLAIGFILFLALTTAAIWLLALWDMAAALPGFELSVEAVEQQIMSWGVWGVACSILLMVLHSFIPFPAELVAMANGMLYGPIWGTVITWTGAMLGAYLAFGLARWLGRPFVLSILAQRHHATMDRWTTRQGAGALLLSRFVPVISFNLINYAAGLTTISWWTFTWTTGIGILPLTILMVLMGDGIWSAHTGIWLWLLATGVLSWLVWQGVVVKTHRESR